MIQISLNHVNVSPILDGTLHRVLCSVKLAAILHDQTSYDFFATIGQIKILFLFHIPAALFIVEKTKQKKNAVASKIH